jgi:hypothetical protein
MKKILFTLLMFCTISECMAQNIRIGTTAPNLSAMLEINAVKELSRQIDELKKNK